MVGCIRGCLFNERGQTTAKFENHSSMLSDEYNIFISWINSASESTVKDMAHYNTAVTNTLSTAVTNTFSFLSLRAARFSFLLFFSVLIVVSTTLG
mgnify:CR=1 FL=1